MITKAWIRKKLRIYISYSTRDQHNPENSERKDFANKIKEACKQAGYTGTKIDSEAVEAGDSLEEFKKQFGKADYVILIVSEEWLRSPHCQDELRYVMESRNWRKKIIPLLYYSTDFLKKRKEFIEEIKETRVAEFFDFLEEHRYGSYTPGNQESEKECIRTCLAKLEKEVLGRQKQIKRVLYVLALAIAGIFCYFGYYRFFYKDFRVHTINVRLQDGSSARNSWIIDAYSDTPRFEILRYDTVVETIQTFTIKIPKVYDTVTVFVVNNNYPGVEDTLFIQNRNGNTKYDAFLRNTN